MQFEIIATVCGRSSQANLINLVARLQGQDYIFLSFMYKLVNYALFVGAELATYIRGLYIPIYLATR